MSAEITPDCVAVVKRSYDDDSFTVEIYNDSDKVKSETIPSQISGFTVRFGEQNSVWFGVTHDDK